MEASYRVAMRREMNRKLSEMMGRERLALSVCSWSYSAAIFKKLARIFKFQPTPLLQPTRIDIMFSAQAGLKFRITPERLQAHFSGSDKLPRPAVLDCDVFIAGSGPIAYALLQVQPDPCL